MKKEKLQKHYVSPLDQFLTAVDREFPKLSPSQQKEQAKYERIYRLRDVADRPDEKKIPGDF